MHHRAHAPELDFRSGPEPFALVPESAPDHAARQAAAEQRERDQAESDLRQMRMADGGTAAPLKTEN